jgi:MFS family permease
VSTPLWSWLERKAQPRTVLQAAAVLRLVAPALALLLPQLLTVEQFQARFGSNAPTVTFAVGFLAIGAALAALARSGPAYLAPLAPRHLSTSYSALTSGLLALAAFAPVAGGLIIQRFSYEALFVATILVGLAGVLSSGWLAEVIVTTRQPQPVTLSPAAVEGVG